jgi:hypothetical protein
MCIGENTKGLFVLASGSFWPPKAVADYQTLSFSVSFYKIRWAKTIQNQHKHIIGLGHATTFHSSAQGPPGLETPTPWVSY